MTVAASLAYTQYTGTGTRTFFEYGFPILEGSAVYVLVDGVVPVFVQQDTGIVITPAPIVDAFIQIYRWTDIDQLADFEPFEFFKGVKTEDAVDKLIMLKQEGWFRVATNLRSIPQLDRVIIDNSRGTDAHILLWNEDEDITSVVTNSAGVWSGLVSSEIPNQGAVVEKPDHFAYLQYGDKGGLTQTLTTTLYPLEAQDALEFSVTLAAGALWPIPVDNMDLGVNFLSGILTDILLETPVYPDNMDLGAEFISGELVNILLSAGPYPDDMDLGVSFVDGLLEAKLVSVYAPDEALEMSVTLASGSMTPV